MDVDGSNEMFELNFSLWDIDCCIRACLLQVVELGNKGMDFVTWYDELDLEEAVIAGFWGDYAA